MSGRNRSEGWQHAKISGHAYEQAFEDAVNDREPVTLRLLADGLEKLGKHSAVAKCSSELGQMQVDDFSGRKTPSKADAIVTLEDNDSVGISIKKSDNGQVQLTRYQRFIDGIEHQTGRVVPDNVKWTLKAFTGETQGLPIEQFAAGVTLTERKKPRGEDLLERVDNRLLAVTLEREFPEQWSELVGWFKTEFEAITLQVFSKGYCARSEHWANIVHYRNKNGDGQPIFILVNDIVRCTGLEKIGPTPPQKSTLWLPWGFLQAHRPTPKGRPKVGPFQLQFHHGLARMKEHLP